MEYAVEKFPDEYLNSTTILAQVYTRIGELSRALKSGRQVYKKDMPTV
jgi:hypothetical protein